MNYAKLQLIAMVAMLVLLGTMSYQLHSLGDQVHGIMMTRSEVLARLPHRGRCPENER